MTKASAARELGSSTSIPSRADKALQAQGNQNDPPVAIVFSAHLDDAVLSAGITIQVLREAGWSVRVATMCTHADPLSVDSLSAHFNSAGTATPTEGLRLRRAEDERAVAHLGARPIHLGFVDASFRWVKVRGQADSSAARDFVTPPFPNERDTRASVSRRFAEVVDGHGASLVLGPFGIGDHVDHLLARSAIEDLRYLRGAPTLALYEDLPYAALMVDLDLVERSQHAEPVIVSGPRKFLTRKLEAVAMYSSQAHLIDLDGADSPLLIEHARRLDPQGGGERVWFV